MKRTLSGSSLLFASGCWLVAGIPDYGDEVVGGDGGAAAGGDGGSAAGGGAVGGQGGFGGDAPECEWRSPDAVAVLQVGSAEEDGIVAVDTDLNGDVYFAGMHEGPVTLEQSHAGVGAENLLVGKAGSMLTASWSYSHAVATGAGTNYQTLHLDNKRVGVVGTVAGDTTFDGGGAPVGVSELPGTIQAGRFMMSKFGMVPMPVEDSLSWIFSASTMWHISSVRQRAALPSMP